MALREEARQVLLKADEDWLKKQQQLFASEAGHLFWHQNRWLEDKAAVDKEIAESEAARAAAVTKMLDGIQTTLDLAGFAPGVGSVPDVINAMISAGRGNFGEAAINLVAAISSAIAKNGDKAKDVLKSDSHRPVESSLVRVSGRQGTKWVFVRFHGFHRWADSAE